MTIARTKALEVRKRARLGFPVYDVRLDALLSRHRIEVVMWHFEGRLTEVMVDHTILLSHYLTRPERRWCKAHALGHFLLHKGRQLDLEDQDPTMLWKWERQADEFAGWLLMGNLDWGWPGMTAWQAAEEAWVPVEDLVEWAEITGVDLSEAAYEAVGG